MSTATVTGGIKLACLDMAGTTVADGGAVEAAFLRALEVLGVTSGDERRDQMLDYVRETMGTSKIEVFRALFSDESDAVTANVAFEAAYDERVASGAVEPIAGAIEAIDRLRRSGIQVALLTGFSVPTRDGIIAALGWQGVADLLLCPSEAGRGRPYPDMVLTALMRLGVDDVASVAVVGDTAADVVSGRRAGARFSVGVLTGADGSERLLAAGATHVLDSIAELPALLGC